MRLPALTCVVLCLCSSISACTSFSSVRSAEVHAGASARVQAALASPPGEGAAWFYNLDCPGCTTIPPAVELGIEYGVLPDSGHAYSFGASLNGVYPQLDGYVVLRRSERSATGIGARVGVPISTWNAHQLYGRYDRVFGAGTRLLYNPVVGLHLGTSPNGQNSGHLLTLVQGIGLQLESRHVTFVPSFALVLATGGRTSYGEPTSFTTAFGTVSASLSFHGAP